MVDGINTIQSNNVQYTDQSKSDLDKDAFLMLMIAQLQNQNPLEPMDGTDYSAQLAQFSSLEQLQNINDSLNMSIDANYLLTQSINNTMTAGLIGKDVKIAGDTITYQGQESTSIGYELPATASEIEVNIYDSNGTLIKSFDNLEKGEGQYKLSWDFTDNDGKAVNSGDYRVEVKAKTMTGDKMAVAQYLMGRIDGVRFSSQGTSIVVNGIEYAISEVFEILDGNYASNGLADNDESGDDGVDDSSEDLIDDFFDKGKIKDDFSDKGKA